MKKYIFIVLQSIFLLLLLILLGTCSIKNNTNSNLSILDITNAKELFIASANNSKGTSDKLFKITDNGYVEEVKYLDEKGNEITIENQPVAIYNINDQYLIVGFGYASNKYEIDDGYLVRKSDGAVFSLANAGSPYTLSDYFANANPIHTDSNGNIYYLSVVLDDSELYNEIVKLNTTDLNNITKESYSPNTESVHTFIVDPNGNAIYNGYLRSNGAQACRIKKANGGLYNLPDIDYNNFWLGLDGNIYYYDLINSVIKKVSIDPLFNVTVTDYASCSYNLSAELSYEAALQKRILFINTWDNKIYEVCNPTGMPREVTLTGISFQSLTLADYSSNFYYIAGVDENSQSFLIKIDPTNDSFEDLIQPRGTYDIYKMTVSDNDEITFNALRMADGAKVIGKIDSSGNLTIIDETLNTEVVALERIN